jgi:hypothetical protein
MEFPPGTQCYACEAPATNREHAPPLCFYPKAKDLSAGAPDLRRNLITVPSCDDHNNPKSQDDEYTACAIVLNAEGSGLALESLASRWIRVLLRNEGALGRRLFAQSRPAVTTDGKDTQLVVYERHRVDRVMQMCTRALFFHDHDWKRRWPEHCTVQSPHFLHRDGREAPMTPHLFEMDRAFDQLERQRFPAAVRRGPHPQVFFYQWVEDKCGTVMMRLVFYGGFKFFAHSRDPMSVQGTTPRSASET